MALVLADRVQQTTTTSGTGTITLSGSVFGYQSFSAIGNGNTTYYTIVDGANWEVGIGTYTASGTTLSRDTVLASSAGGTTKITLSGATANVFVTYPAERSVNLSSSALTSGRVPYATTDGLLTDASGFSFSGTALTFPTPFTLGATSVTTTGTQFNYLNAATGTTGTTSSNIVFSASPTLSGTVGGALTFSGALTLSSALTYGGVTLSNAVTGTGNMVLSASPTLTGTALFSAFTASGQATFSGAGITPRITDTGASGADIYFNSKYNATAGNFVIQAASGTVGAVVGGTQIWTTNASNFTLSASLVYGGVTLSNSVTGTGSMVLSASPTLTGTLAGAAANLSGKLGVGGNLSVGIAQFQVTGSAGNFYVRDNGQEAYFTTNGANYFGCIGGASASLNFTYGSGSVGAKLGSDGSFLVGTTTNGGWGTDAKIEGQTSTGCGVSGYATGNGGQAVRGRVDDYTSGTVFAGYGGSSLRLQLTVDSGGNTSWLSAGTAKAISGGSGGVQLTSGATAWAAICDETTKTDLLPIQSGAEKVASLRAVTGRYKSDAEGVSRSFLIAQDVKAVLPEAVSEDADGVLSLRYTEVIPLLVAAIKELNNRLAALEA